jgi:hypothetical protein
MRRDWPTYAVPAREDDVAEGRLYSYPRADELTPAELAGLSPEEQAEATIDLAEMDADPDLVGADDSWAWRDHERARDTDRPGEEPAPDTVRELLDQAAE